MSEKLTTEQLADAIMELQADITALSYHLQRALNVLCGDNPLDVNQIAEAKRALENSTAPATSTQEPHDNNK